MLARPGSSPSPNYPVGPIKCRSLSRRRAIAWTRLFLIQARRLPQHEMSERRGDGLGRVVLPRLRLESDDAPTLLDNRHVGVAVEGVAGAQVVDRQADRFGWRHAEFARHAHDRGRFEEGAGHAAVDGGQDRVADDFWRERHNQRAILADADAETTREWALGEWAGRIL